MNLSSTIQTDKTLLKMQEHGLFLLADHVLIVPHSCPIVSDAGTRFLSAYAWIITRINLPSSYFSPFPPNPFPDSWQINTPIRLLCKILHSTALCCPLLLGWSPGLPLGFQDSPSILGVSSGSFPASCQPSVLTRRGLADCSHLPYLFILCSVLIPEMSFLSFWLASPALSWGTSYSLVEILIVGVCQICPLASKILLWAC